MEVISLEQTAESGKCAAQLNAKDDQPQAELSAHHIPLADARDDFFLLLTTRPEQGDEFDRFNDLNEPGNRGLHTYFAKEDLVGKQILDVVLTLKESGDKFDWLSVAEELTKKGKKPAADRLFDAAARQIETQIETRWQDCLKTLNDHKNSDDFKAEQFEFSTGDALNDCLNEITWLWPGYVPNGFVTLLVGEQDAGKSTVAQNFCQTILSGGRWPDGTRYEAEADKLLWLDTEGSLALFRQRAHAWKIPLNRFVFPRDPLQELRVDRPEDWRWIEAAIERFKPRLIVLDSLSGAHSGEENSNDGMKEVLKRLSELAQRHQIAIVVIHHLSKAAPGVPDYPVNLSRARGAGAITQFCRSVIALTSPDPANPTARRLDVIKLNLATKPKACGYELTDDGPAWGHAPEPPQQRRAADDATDWLRDALGDGMRPSKEITAEASAAGISYNALNDAKKALGVTAKREGGGKDGRWFLTMK